MNTIPINATKPPLSIWLWLLFGLLGLVLGVGSALMVSKGALSKGKIMSGRWSTDPNVGAKAANPWLRARIARVGLLGLTKTETIYFDRTTDDGGQPLRDSCSYRLSGAPLATRWWSITLYDGEDFLPRNSDLADSIDATRALASGATLWQGQISQDRPANQALWISSKNAGAFSLTLRLYNPASVNQSDLEKMDLPKVERISCDPTAGSGAR